jgi:molecular chaperone HscB
MLRDPVGRAEYLLQLRGVDATAETDTHLPVAFLTRQLERREAADEAVDRRDEPALRALLDAVDEDAARLRGEVEHALDGNDLQAARSRVRELRFLSKLAEDIDAMRTVELDG